MSTLKGRPIGLKAYMSKEEMKEHINKKIAEWKKEGFPTNEIAQAIITKCRPLVYGYYWHRYPDACQTLHSALLEMNMPIETKLPKKQKTRQKTNVNRTRTIDRKIQNDIDFLKQFIK